MNIYLLKYSEKEDDYLSLLSDQRRKTADDIKNKKVRREKIYSYILLRYALLMEYAVFGAPNFTFGEKGKPFLKDNPKIHFSISHAGGYAACVALDFPIGLDIQDYRPMKEDISLKICTKRELMEAYGGDSPSPSETTCKLWSMKEARAKLTGKGFAEGFDRIETGDLREKGELISEKYGDDLFVSVCGYEPLPKMNIIVVDEKEMAYTLL